MSEEVKATAKIAGESVEWSLNYYRQHLGALGLKESELLLYFVPADDIKPLFDAKGGDIKIILRAVTPEQLAKSKQGLSNPAVFTWTPEAATIE